MSNDVAWLVPLASIEASYAGGTLFGARLTEIARGRTVFEMPITADTAGGAGGVRRIAERPANALFALRAVAGV